MLNGKLCTPPKEHRAAATFQPMLLSVYCMCLPLDLLSFSHTHIFVHTHTQSKSWHIWLQVNNKSIEINWIAKGRSWVKTQCFSAVAWQHPGAISVQFPHSVSPGLPVYLTRMGPQDQLWEMFTGSRSRRKAFVEVLSGESRMAISSSLQQTHLAISFPRRSDAFRQWHRSCASQQILHGYKWGSVS